MTTGIAMAAANNSVVTVCLPNVSQLHMNRATSDMKAMKVFLVRLRYLTSCGVFPRLR